MKAATSKGETKKRKRDLKEPVAESQKKAKVHAQRKFAQGAAFNSSVITPIKDKVRPAAASSGPMLTSKCPNTEDFLTFLCFRRTSILPPKLDFFKDALGFEQESASNSNQKALSEKGGSTGGMKKLNVKKSDANDEKKSQPGAVQALRRKYQEQRLAKQKVTNVTKLARKVKGKNMVRTRSSEQSRTAPEEPKDVSKKQISGKQNKTSSKNLRSGLKITESAVNKPCKKVARPKNLRMGLRSRGLNINTKQNFSQIKSASVKLKKIDKEIKKSETEIPELKTKNEKLKKAEGFSDFSSDDNEPLLAVKKPKISAKKSVKSLSETVKVEKKMLAKTQAVEAESTKTPARPTRKTKEAAAIYMEMITKKLVSPDKSGDEDVWSVDSFPELPNAKRNEQRETEIREKNLANKKGESKQQMEDRVKESKKIVSKKTETPKPEITKEEGKNIKRVMQVSKKESKTNAKQEDNSILAKKVSRSSIKDKKNSVDDEKKEQSVPNVRPSTRSRHQEEMETGSKKNLAKAPPTKTLKASQSNENQTVEKPSQVNKKSKVKAQKPTAKKEMTENEKGNKDVKDATEQPDKAELESVESTELKERKEKSKEGNTRKGKKSMARAKSDVKEAETKNATTNPKKPEKKESKTEITSTSGDNKRPTRKCSAADKICFEIDAFTSDEDEFFNTIKTIKTKATTKKPNSIKDKAKSKKETGKKPNRTESNTVDGKRKNEKPEFLEEELAKEELKKLETKKGKLDEVSENKSLKTEIEIESKNEENLERKPTKSEEKEEPQKNESSQVTDDDKKGKEQADSSQLESDNLKAGSDISRIVIDETVIKDSSGKNEAAKESSSPPRTAVTVTNVTEVEKKSFALRKGKKSKEEEKELDRSKEDMKKGRWKSRETKGIKRKMEASRTLRDRVVAEDQSESSVKSGKRTRPVRKCSTGEKKWIETDSDSFSFYETTDDEDNLPIFDFGSKNKEKSSPVRTDTNGSRDTCPEEEKKEEKVKVGIDSKLEGKKHEEDPLPYNFSDSDEEPLKKRALIADSTSLEKSRSPNEWPSDGNEEVKTPVKTQREVPDLHPLKKAPSELQPSIGGSSVSKTLPETDRPIFSAPVANEPNPLLFDAKNLDGKSEGSKIRPSPTKEEEDSNLRNQFSLANKIDPVPSGSNKIEKILFSLKKDKKPAEGSLSSSHSNDVKVTFGNVPYHPPPHPSSHFIQTPCNYQMKPPGVSFPTPREPISTHGLDLLSEVALPTTPKEKFSSQTERIEKWLKDSLAAEQKKNFPAYEDGEFKSAERVRKMVLTKPEAGPYFGKSVSPVSSHPEVHKFSQADLTASQKLLKRNVFPSSATAVKVDSRQSTPPKKVVTTVQDLLKLQKERKDVAKSPVDNSPHLKNCKCNNCIVKKGWFKNKPVPKVDQLQQQKSSPIEDCEASAKPFQSLVKAFPKEGKSPQMSVSVVAPTVVNWPSPSAAPQGSSTPGQKKGIFHQRKLSFLERMKERERKESAASKSSPNPFSPNNESSVYAFEPESEKASASKAPFRRKARESRTSSASKSDDESPLKACEEEPASGPPSSGPPVEKSPAEGKPSSSKASQSASIAVQVNLDSETTSEAEAAPEIQDGKSMEISTQTEVPEEDSDTPMFYIPLQQATTAGTSDSSERQLIQGVALKLGTEGPMGPNQRVVMEAKLVTKPPGTPSIKAVVMPQPKRIFDQKNNNPPIGTVQPTTRKPPEEPKVTKTTVEPVSPKDPPVSTAEVPGATLESPASKSSKSSPAATTTTTTTTMAKPLVKSREKAKDKTETTSDDCSPCSSASSQKSKRTAKQKSSETVINPISGPRLPSGGSAPKLAEAPTFHATEKDFQDPFEFFDRIRPAAERFGLCRIVPPSSFKPDCKVSDDMRFTAYNQYVHRMFHRWGSNIREMMAIKKYLATQSISLKQPPWIGGIEVDLPRLYQTVQNCGGLMKVMEKKKWNQVADMMKIPKAAQDRVTKLDDIYCKYLLPYDTLSPEERQKLFDEVEKDWLERQRSPATEISEDEADEENYIEECEECVVKGRNMALNQFYRIARNTMSMWFKNVEPSPREVENEFWRHVSERNHHVCVHSGSIDSSGWGYGFPIAKNNSFSKHPWNLKVLTNNSRSVLRSLGPVMGVTVPTLHVGMVFAAFCWYRDPHGLPWIEYLHTGAPKIWYGISDDNSAAFQDALSKLLPRYIKKKTIWLASDTAMIPPALLVEHGVSLCHTIQEPGQFILVFPRSFISSICTGYLVSESVYFAQASWLTTAEKAFEDIQESCEPSMFSLEKLLFSIATDSRSSVDVLKQVLPMVWHVKQKEIDGRKTLFNLGLKTSERLPSREFGNKKRKGRWAQDDEGEYECEICRRNLFVSLVTNSHEEGTYCLQHAIELLTQKRHQLKYCKLMYSYTQEEMNELVEKLEQKIEAKSQKKPLGKAAATTSK